MRTYPVPTTNKHKEKCCTSLVIGKTHIKTTQQED